MAEVIGNLSVLIGADLSGLASGVDRAKGHLLGVERSAIAMTRAMTLAAGAAVAAGIGIGVHLTRQSLDAIDVQSKLARQLGGTVEGLQTLTRHADLAGISSEELTKAADRMNKRLGQAMREPLGETADALKRIGLNAKSLSQLDVDERFAVIADQVKKLGLSAQQTADFLGQLGIRGGKLFNLLEDGGEAIRKSREDVRLFGVAVSDVDAKMIERANDAMTVFGLAAKGAGNQMAISLAPVLQHIADQFRKFAEDSGGFEQAFKDVVRNIVVGLGVLPAMIHNIQWIWNKFVGLLIDGLNAFGTGWNATLGTIMGKLPTLENAWGNFADQMGKAPTAESWGQWFDTITTKARMTALTVADVMKAIKGPAPAADLDNVGSKERKQLEDKLLRLKQAVASEDEVLRLQKEKQLKELDEFDQKGIIKKAESNALRLQIENEYRTKLNELIQAKFEEGWLGEDEILARKYEKQLADLLIFENNKTMTAEKAAMLRGRIEQKHMTNMLQITARGYSGLASIVDTSMGAISQIVGSEGEKQFGIMKTIAAATALVKGYEAAVSAYAAGSAIGGPAVGAAFAAIAAAGTAAIIAKLAGVGGGGAGVSAGASSGGGATATAAATSAQETGGIVQSLHVSGIDPRQMFSGETVRQLAEQLLQYQRDGGKVIIV